MSLSTLTAIDLIPENSLATPGLFNHIFSQLSDNIGTMNSVAVPPAVLSGSTWASINLVANSSTGSDYIRFQDSANQRSTYRLGSFAGGTADGLNIFDESGNTMIVSFSKQSIRFFQQVVGPVFDVGGALANTLNAATFGSGADSKETRIQSAINAAALSSISRVYLPNSMYPYSASSISFIHSVQMTREGGNDAVYDVQAYGAYGDGTHSDISAFVGCRQGAVLAGRAIYIPGVTYGRYYNLTSTWTFTGDTNVRITGDGLSSVVVITSTTGANCITLDGCSKSHIQDITISGLSGSGHGIEYTGSSHLPTLRGVTIAWVDKNGVEVTRAISGRMEQCSVNQNTGFDPANLGVPRGNVKIGLNVSYNTLGLNNGWSCVNCDLEGSYIYNLKVGSTGSGLVQSFAYLGGTIQGSGFYNELYLRTDTGLIEGTHIEPPTGSTTSFVVTLDRCLNTVIRNCQVQGDVEFQGACNNSGIEHVRGSGYSIGEGCVRTFIRDSECGNILTGPCGGAVRDRAMDTEIQNVKNGSNDYLGYGYRRTSREILNLTGKDWDKLNSTWCQLNNIGSTVSQLIDANNMAVIQTGFRGADFAQYIGSNLNWVGSYRGKWVTVDAKFRNRNTKRAYLEGIRNGSSTAFIESTLTSDTTERLQGAFYVDPADTSFGVRLTGESGATIDWYSVIISAEDFAPLRDYTLDTSATPSLNDFLPQQSIYSVPRSATAITSMTGAMLAKPFTLYFAGNRTINDAQPFKLAGAGNFSAVTGDTLTLVLASDGTYYEVGRTVN